MTKPLADAKASQDRHSRLVGLTNGAGQGILANDLMTGLRGMIPVLGDRKVTVGFAGTDAFCDATFSYVNIPALPPGEIIPIGVAREIRGFAAHEAAHLAFTDLEVFPAKIVNAKGEFDKLLKEIWNCVEDFMIEKHWLALYPGARKNFAATEARCCASYLAMHAQDPAIADDLRRVGPVALTWMRSLYFRLGVSDSRACLDTLPAAFRPRVAGWFQDIEGVETTQDCLDAAKKIWADILQDFQNPQAQPQSGQSPGGNGQTGQGQPGQPQAGQSSSASGQNTPDQSGAGAGQPPTGQSAQGQATQSGDTQAQSGNTAAQGNGAAGQPGSGSKQSGQGQSGQGSASGQSDPASGQGSDQSGPQAAGQTPGQAAGHGPRGGASGAPVMFPGNAGPDPISTSADITTVMAQFRTKDDDTKWLSAEVLSTSQSGPASMTIGAPTGRAAAQDALRNLRGPIGATSQHLRRALQALAKDRWKGGRTDGKIDPKRVAHVATGNLEVHRRKVLGEKIDTAVSILVDCSSSMRKRIHVCRDLALMLESAFNGTPIAHEIIGFTTGDVAHASAEFATIVAANAARGTQVSIRAINLYAFREFNASHGQALQGIGNMTDVDMAMTPTSDAILMAHDRLSRRPERRHVMFVLTDGAADSQIRCAEAVKAVEACGVTVIGIGIGTTAVENSFTHHAVLAQASELPSLMMSRLSSILIGDRKLVAKKGLAAQLARAG